MAPAQVWTQYRGPHRTGVGKLHEDPRARLENLGATLWEFDDEQRMGAISNAVLDEENAYYVSGGYLLALDYWSGEEQWRAHMYDPEKRRGAVSHPTVAEGSLFVGGRNGTLYAYNASTGKQRWTYPTGGPILSSPTVADGRIFFLSQDSLFYALDAQTGERVWSFLTHWGGNSSPTVAGNTVYVGCQEFVGTEGYLYALDTKSGALKWQFEAKGSIQGVPVIAHGNVYVVSDDGYLFAVDTATGQEKWQYNLSANTLSSPTVTDSAVYVMAHGNGIAYAVHAHSGKELWQRNFSAYQGRSILCGESVIINNFLLMGSAFLDGRGRYQYRLHALNPNTGEERWHHDLSAAVKGTPVSHYNLLLLSDNNQALTAYISTLE